ncbi:hypothetical protein [Wolbachia endosymbiont of Encarsia formosa]|uniref:hypothetical protein n=1 Tax=Wolbachia endosymbiont of Encarsia formosa TaxID=77125 RepID=UPI0031BBA362
MGKFEAIKTQYSNKGIWSAAKEVSVQGWNLVKENPYKTAATFAAIALVTSLTAAYFLSPAYASFVGTVGTKAAELVTPAIATMSAFEAAHPLIASLVVLAAVAALITAPVYAYMNSSKSEEVKPSSKVIEETKETVHIEGEPNTQIDNIKSISYPVKTPSA